MKRVAAYKCECGSLKLTKFGMEQHEKTCAYMNRGCAYCKHFVIGSIVCRKELDTKGLRLNCDEFEHQEK